MFTACLVVGLGVAGQMLLGRLVSSPWLTPDLTLVVLALVMTGRRELTIGPAVAAGWLTMLMADRAPWVQGLGYVAVGGFMLWLALRWDVTSPRIKTATIAASESGLVVLWWLSGSLTWELLRLGIARVAITVAAALVIQGLLQIAGVTRDEAFSPSLSERRDGPR